MFSFIASTRLWPHGSQASTNAAPDHTQRQPIRQTAIALLSTTLVLGNMLPLTAAESAESAQSNHLPAHWQAQRQSDWDATLHMAELLDDDGDPTALVIQLDIDDKPATTYANAVYQVFAKVGNRWTEIYTNTGARLIGASASGALLPPEVIELSVLEEGLEREEVERINWNNLDLKATVQVRYDTRNRRDRSVVWEQEVTYRAIAQTYSTQIATETTLTRTHQSLEPLFDDIGTPNNQQSPHRGHFNLAILQKNVTVPDVIARVSLKSKRPESYLGERLIGDFQYAMNQRSQFIRGLNPGDRVVVRLFSTAGEFLGYSEFELLDENAAVNLVLSDNPWRDRLVRTVYGVDRDRNGTLDRNAIRYDYFSYLSYASQYYQDTNVTFLRTANNINLNAFNVSTLPHAQRDCAYPRAFQSGSFAMVNRTIAAFHTGLAEAFIMPPGHLVQVTDIRFSQTMTTHEVSRLLITHREVGFSDNVILTTCDLGCSDRDDDDYEWDEDDYEWDDDDFEWDDDEWDDD